MASCKRVIFIRAYPTLTLKAMKEGGHSYDVVDFVNTNDNSPVTLYFDVTVPEQYGEKSLSR